MKISEAELRKLQAKRASVEKKTGEAQPGIDEDSSEESDGLQGKSRKPAPQPRKGQPPGQQPQAGKPKGADLPEPIRLHIVEDGSEEDDTDEGDESVGGQGEDQSEDGSALGDDGESGNEGDTFDDEPPRRSTRQRI